MELDGKNLEALIVCIYWILSKENKRVLKKIDKTVDSIFDEIRNHNKVISILDKNVYLSNAKKVINDFVEAKSFTDKNVLEYLDLSLNEAGTEEIESFIEILCIHIHKDKKLSAREQESLGILKKRYNIDDDLLNSCILKTKNKNFQTKSHAKDVHQGIRREYAARIFLLIIGIGALTFTGYSVWIFINAKQNFSTFNMAEVVENNPKLVFKRASFYKYIIVGTPDDASSYFKKLDFYHVKGSADFQFDMSRLVIDEEKTNRICKVLCLRYVGDDGHKFPLEVDVNINPADIYPIPMEEMPKPVSKDTAKKIAKVAAVPAGLLGGILGGKVGSSIGGSIVPFWGKIIGGTLGSLTGAGAAGYGTYVMTSNFFTGLHAKGLTLGQKDMIIESSKPLVALELMGGNFLSGDSWADDVKKHYIDEFEATLQRLFRAYGWEKVKIENMDI